MRKRALGMFFAVSLCGLAVAAPAVAADYAPPRQVYVPPPAPVYQPPVQSSCCCPTIRRGLWSSFGCGYRSGFVEYPQAYPSYQYQQPYPAPAYYPQPYPAYQPYPEPAYYQPGYAPQVGVGIGPVGVGVGVRYQNPRRHCWRHKGHWVCR